MAAGKPGRPRKAPPKTPATDAASAAIAEQAKQEKENAEPVTGEFNANDLAPSSDQGNVDASEEDGDDDEQEEVQDDDDAVASDEKEEPAFNSDDIEDVKIAALEFLSTDECKELVRRGNSAKKIFQIALHNAGMNTHTHAFAEQMRKHFTDHADVLKDTSELIKAL
jgi:hypothetical protein